MIRHWRAQIRRCCVRRRAILRSAVLRATVGRGHGPRGRGPRPRPAMLRAAGGRDRGRRCCARRPGGTTASDGECGGGGGTAVANLEAAASRPRSATRRSSSALSGPGAPPADSPAPRPPPPPPADSPPPDAIALAAASGGGRMPTAVFEEARSSLHGVLPDPIYAGLSCTDGDASRLPIPAGDKGGPCRCRAGRWSRPPLPLPGRQELVLPSRARPLLHARSCGAGRRLRRPPPSQRIAAKEARRLPIPAHGRRTSRPAAAGQTLAIPTSQYRRLHRVHHPPRLLYPA
ncbi:hypothetical protein PVAP13_4KG408101 [Panicum virgatum]|uniref:Uncharacterized protein n=1 Tax=Panicum virgatum TaxID=38727 RepID=A0A8T0TWQ0_PANVG|nr:hypothetical protein PVAP13_4KG408101 [Panicum virgatum]